MRPMAERRYFELPTDETMSDKRYFTDDYLLRVLYNRDGPPASQSACSNPYDDASESTVPGTDPTDSSRLLSLHMHTSDSKGLSF